MSLPSETSTTVGPADEPGPLTDIKSLKRQRVKFGIGTLLFQSEEMGLGGIPTSIIRSLGGDFRHIGIFGAMYGVISLFSWVGTEMLKFFKSNRKAMIALTVAGLTVSLLLVLSILSSYLPGLKPLPLYAFLTLALVLAAVTGIQWNLESNWIGDLVPKGRLAWFTSVKWIMSVIGALCFSFLLGRIADKFPNLKGYTAIYWLFAVSFAIAARVYATIPDREPKNANFVSDGPDHHQRLNYRSRALICYLLFYSLWTGGRTVFWAFSAAYLMDAFHFSMTDLAWLLTIQYVVSCIVMFTIGKLADRSGHRIFLLFVSGTVATSMFLWVASAWWGIGAIIVFQIINGMAGMTHSMLATNYAIEILPAKGRSGYFAFSQICIGIVSIITPVVAGKAMQHWAAVQIPLWGATLTKYHLMFVCCSLFTMSCVIPLLIAGKRKVEAFKAEGVVTA
jgi:MFS family permease